MKQEEPILVAIHCLVYNHEPYLRDCFEGFVMQKTNFRFVAIVHEDCSTDHSADIIREYEEKYPDIIKPIYETENQWSKHDGSLERIMNDAIAATGAKYIVMCEGDDYWTDPLKLQKQVDMLESDEQIGFCFTRLKIRNQMTGEIRDDDMREDAKWDFESMLLAEPQITCTVIYRHDLYRSYLEEIKPGTRRWLMGDTPLWLYLAAKGKVAYMPEITGVYRVLELSASHTGNLEKRIAFNKSARDIRLFFCDKYFPDRKDWMIAVEDVYHRWNMYDAIGYQDLRCAVVNWVRIHQKTDEDNEIISKFARDHSRLYRTLNKVYRRLF